MSDLGLMDSISPSMQLSLSLQARVPGNQFLHGHESNSPPWDGKEGNLELDLLTNSFSSVAFLSTQSDHLDTSKALHVRMHSQPSSLYCPPSSHTARASWPIRGRLNSGSADQPSPSYLMALSGFSGPSHKVPIYCPPCLPLGVRLSTPSQLIAKCDAEG
jgi:hypothetical protein